MLTVPNACACLNWVRYHLPNHRWQLWPILWVAIFSVLPLNEVRYAFYYVRFDSLMPLKIMGQTEGTVLCMYPSLGKWSFTIVLEQWGRSTDLGLVKTKGCSFCLDPDKHFPLRFEIQMTYHTYQMIFSYCVWQSCMHLGSTE